MPASTVRTFTDPDAYYEGIQARRVTGIVTGCGDFHAELTRIDFDHVLIQRAAENLPRVLYLETTAHHAALIFAADQQQPEMHFSGIPLLGGDIIAWNAEASHHFRSTRASRWGSMSLSYDELAAVGETIAGHELRIPPVPLRIRMAARRSRLVNLHEAAGHLAKTVPDILEAPEVARAMEQALIEAMISCLASGEPDHRRGVRHRQSTVMRRFEDVLRANFDRPLYTAELCAATGVSYPTLRAYCRAHLGMSPKRYLLLRRMHLARCRLQQADVQKTTVTKVATDYGFWELGRFSVVYRSLFGETPTATLRRPPDDPRPDETVEAPWEFTKSA